MERKIAIIVIELEPETKNINNDELEFYIAEETENRYKIPWLKNRKSNRLRLSRVN